MLTVTPSAVGQLIIIIVETVLEGIQDYYILMVKMIVEFVMEKIKIKIFATYVLAMVLITGKWDEFCASGWLGDSRWFIHSDHFSKMSVGFI